MSRAKQAEALKERRAAGGTRNPAQFSRRFPNLAKALKPQVRSLDSAGVGR